MTSAKVNLWVEPSRTRYGTPLAADRPGLNVIQNNVPQVWGEYLQAETAQCSIANCMD